MTGLGVTPGGAAVAVACLGVVAVALAWSGWERARALRAERARRRRAHARAESFSRRAADPRRSPVDRAGWHILADAQWDLAEGRLPGEAAAEHARTTR